MSLKTLYLPVSIPSCSYCAEARRNTATGVLVSSSSRGAGRHACTGMGRSVTSSASDPVSVQGCIYCATDRFVRPVVVFFRIQPQPACSCCQRLLPHVFVQRREDAFPAVLWGHVDRLYPPDVAGPPDDTARKQQEVGALGQAVSSAKSR